MEGDDNLGSFTAPEPSSSGGNMFIPLAIALVGVLLGGIALYLAFAGSGQSTETKAALQSASEQTQALEARLAGIEEKLTKLSTDMTSQDTRLRNLASQTQTALNQVGQEINATRQQNSTTAEKVAEISEKLAAANAPRPAPSATTASSSSTTASASPNLATGNAPNRSPTGSAAPGHREHTIASGETFAKLANQYGVSIDAILSANPDTDPRRLQVGQKIKIPHNDHERE